MENGFKVAWPTDSLPARDCELSKIPGGQRDLPFPIIRPIPASVA
jgi:hypothetical protein